MKIFQTRNKASFHFTCLMSMLESKSITIFQRWKYYVFRFRL